MHVLGSYFSNPKQRGQQVANDRALFGSEITKSRVPYYISYPFLICKFVMREPCHAEWIKSGDLNCINKLWPEYAAVVNDGDMER